MEGVPQQVQDSERIARQIRGHPRWLSFLPKRKHKRFRSPGHVVVPGDQCSLFEGGTYADPEFRPTA